MGREREPYHCGQVTERAIFIQPNLLEPYNREYNGEAEFTKAFMPDTFSKYDLFTKKSTGHPFLTRQLIEFYIEANAVFWSLDLHKYSTGQF